ncbi:MAG: DUF1592 domain-containing protein, partial [Planctomycetales bacterium]|nr:DUF1592 domain-containing protein [Planctomycetales bacterium]
MPNRRLTLLNLSAALFLGAWPLLPAHAADSSAGREVYQSLCADCHGEAGQGSEEYPTALTGDLSVEQLTKLIGDTMPEGRPGDCVGEQASAVAAYVFDEFYSHQAQARRAPRRELSHLTARQYEQSLLDLLGSFGWQGRHDGRRGLTAEFFKGQGADPNQRVRDEITPGVDFRLVDSGFYEQSQLFPENPATDDPMGRARAQSAFMKWTGGVIAPETGDYEFLVNCNAGFQLWVNGERPLLDRAVQSGDEHGGRARLRLLEGHAYHLRLEVTRVFEPDVEVRLSWKPPGGVEQPIPSRMLSPHPQPMRYVTARALPPDDRSEGFLRGSSISALWDESTTQAALPVGEWAMASAAPLKEANGADKARDYCVQFAERALRRPLTDSEIERLVDRYFGDPQGDWRWAVKASLVRSLKSPEFLYPELAESDASPDWRAASRLALALWDSLPDEPLMLTARKQDLHTHDQITRHSGWMLKDPRAAAKVKDFFRSWLHIKRADQINRDPQAFPGFSPRLAADMRTSLEMTLDKVMWSDGSDYRRLLLSNELYVNERIAAFYEIDLPEKGSSEFQR